MKRYLVFVCQFYCPSGGWDDLHSSYDSLEDVWEWFIDNRNIKRNAEIQIVDSVEMRRVYLEGMS